ncbi:MAG: hypothetical protein ACK4JB_22070 [Reyranella sp.]
MPMFILLSEEQADKVRGRSIAMPSSTLDPIERQGGVFILGIEVLVDPAHEPRRALLSALPQIDGNDPAFPVSKPSVDA